MNVLDEHFPLDQREQLRQWRIRTRHIGFDLGQPGMQDEQIIVLLRRLARPTLFTRDEDFYRRRLGHAHYALVFLDIQSDDSAEYVRRVLRHPEFNTISSRLGCVVRVTAAGLTAWRLRRQAVDHVAW